MGRNNDQQQSTPRDPDEDSPEIKEPPNDLPDYTDPPAPQPSDPPPPPVKAREFDPNDLNNYVRDESVLYHIGQPGGGHMFHMHDPLSTQLPRR